MATFGWLPRDAWNVTLPEAIGALCARMAMAGRMMQLGASILVGHLFCSETAAAVDANIATFERRGEKAKPDVAMQAARAALDAENREAFKRACGRYPEE